MLSCPNSFLLVHSQSSQAAKQGESDKVLEAIERWTQAAQQPEGGADAEELGRIVEDLLQQESSYAERNAKRFRLVNEAFQEPNFTVVAHCVDFLMLPLDNVINKLLKRTSTLRHVRFRDSQVTSTAQELKEELKEFFLQWASGTLGENVIDEFVCQMKSGQLARIAAASTDPSILQTCFELVVFAMSDTWLRFCLPAQTFPNKMFSLTACCQQAFMEKWQEFRDTLQRCPECVDVGFSSKLLGSSDLVQLSERDLQTFVRKLLIKYFSTFNF